MKKSLAILLVLLPLVGGAQTAIGRWRDCLDYNSTFRIEPAADCIYAAGRTGLMYCRLPEREVGTLSKASGLSDAGISTIAFDSTSGSLVVAYTNANIDIIVDGSVYNISDIKRSDMLGDKSVYSIRFRRGTAYLTTGFGIVAVDLGRREIIETYYIGAGGAHTAVYDLVFTADSLYAATAEGLKRIAATEPHLGISDRWQTDARLAGVALKQLEYHCGTLMVTGYTIDPAVLTLYCHTDTGYRSIVSGEIQSIRTGGGMLTISTLDGVLRYDGALSFVDSVTVFTDWANVEAYDAVVVSDGSLWVAHNWLGMLCIAPGVAEFYLPESPTSDDKVYRLVPTLGRMMLCPGGHTTTYANSYLNPEMSVSDGRHWKTVDRSGGQLDGAFDIVDAAVNPRDTTEVYMAVWGSGIAQVRSDTVRELYNADNTDGALTIYQGYLRTGALAFDWQGNLWALNSHSPYALVVRRSDGTWEHLSTEALSSQLQVDKLIWDSVNNYLWFAGRDNAIYVHDGVSRVAQVNPNNGSKLQTESVNALVQDRLGNIWIGTNKGIKVIYDGSKAFTSGGYGETAPVNCSNITITNGDFYEYLMAYENITAIAVDGANRKWVGTASGGLYLLSANGLEQLAHYTAADSPLMSDKIIALGIQPASGEVYVGTAMGLQVFRSTATYAESTPLEHIYAFPNPVRPGYDGPVAIKGFTRDALVHVTDAAGHVVFATQALGGQAIWNARTASGERVASGVYYVFASDAEGGNRSVAKILVVR